jgi:hypothetical protein
MKGLDMNFTQSFEEFSKGLSSTDLMLYAGIGLVIWVLFKDKLSPVQGVVNLALESIGGLFSKKTVSVVTPATTVVVDHAPSILASAIAENSKQEPEELFFKLVVSWKETRDLALKCGCGKAVEVADEMFPYLSPNVCGKDTNE